MWLLPAPTISAEIKQKCHLDSSFSSTITIGIGDRSRGSHSLKRMSQNNVTVDDADPSVSYLGNVWHFGPTCTVCVAIPPDLNMVYDLTWHDGLLSSTDPNAMLTAQLSFTGNTSHSTYKYVYLLSSGTAIYVYGITINNTTPLPTVKNQDLVFFIDGAQAGTFTFEPDGPDYTYNVNLFAASNLSPTPHTLLMSVQNNSFVLLDYFIYTSPRYLLTAVSYQTSQTLFLALAVPVLQFPLQTVAVSVLQAWIPRRLPHHLALRIALKSEQSSGR